MDHRRDVFHAIEERAVMRQARSRLMVLANLPAVSRTDEIRDLTTDDIAPRSFAPLAEAGRPSRRQHRHIGQLRDCLRPALAWPIEAGGVRPSYWT
ncbi:hypothetical protein NS226_04580 [Aureimonas ureilytica]|uniref:Uncharacterized protein n=1 Tax=Aureimonas ureilytica TaxID=401562 RepID=A0A175RCB4_9HYPH|nr:hypothetical protein NS226_04580 [Aureimonas ureilytica]